MIVHVAQGNFQREIEQHAGLALVEFWAPWYKPCRVLAPIIESIAQKYEGRVKVAKVNLDENNNLALRFSVKLLPTLLFFRDGIKLDEHSGVFTEALVDEALQKMLAPSR
jgi:thioredoxin 1